jgi:hypothetical protein
MANADGKTLIRFNVKNVKYATKGANGTWGDLISYGSATKMAIQADTSVKKIYGDGKSILTIVNEKGKSATLTTNNVSDDYEIVMTRKMKTANGLADVKQMQTVVHVIYFETEGADATGKTITAKTMLYGVTSSRPSENFDQTTDDINENTFDTPLTIDGVELLAADGTNYKDDKGNEVLVWQETVTPDMDNYSTFGTSVVMPKVEA